MLPPVVPPRPLGHRIESAKFTPISTREWAVAATLCVWLTFLPWAFGTVRVWGQLIALALAIGALLIAVFWRAPTGTAEAVPPWPALPRLPLFWISIAVLGYVIAGSLNPNWTYVNNGTAWWMKRTSAVPGLPAGVDTPFSEMNGWRQLVIWLSPICAASALWLGITRRRLLQLLISTMAVNGAAISLLGIVQRSTRAEAIFWRFDFQKSAFFGSFIYKNHAAAYLIIALLSAAGLALWHYRHGLRVGARSTPAPLFALLALLISAGLLYSRSRIGIALSAIALASFLVWSVRLLVRETAGRAWLPITTIILFVLLGGIGFWQTGAFALRLPSAGPAVQTNETSARIRIYGSEIAREMFLDNLAYGGGAGSFRFLTPNYMPRFPEVGQFSYYYKRTKEVKRFRLSQAHNDFMQTLAEFGLIGGSLIFAAMAVGLGSVSSLPRRQHPVGLAALIVLLVLLGYAWVDFPMQNPAVLSTLVMLCVVACRWADLEQANFVSSSPPG